MGFFYSMLLVYDFLLLLGEVGIIYNSDVVVYDICGIYSVVRVWWVFKVMGYKKVCILDGG